MSVHMNWSYVCHQISQSLLTNDHFVQHFHTLSTNEDKVSHCLSQPDVGKQLDQFLSVTSAAKHRKYWEKAKEFRIEGNHSFRGKRFPEAIEAYTQAIITASIPNSSDTAEANGELSLGFANRSAVFFQLKQYDNCLSDINNAFKYDYPLNATKLLLRKTNCLVAKARFGDAKTVLQSAELSGDLNDKQLETQINKLLETIDSKGAKNRTNCVNTTKPKTDLKFVSNELMPNASQSLRLCESPTKGRHIVTKDDINISDVLFMEKPFSSVLLPQYYKTHCHQCYGKLVDRPVMPCLKCTQVRYCSDECRSDGWYECHQYECGYLDVLHDIGIAHLAFRTLLVCGVENAIQVANNYSSSQSSSIPYKSDYQSVYALVDHSNDFAMEDSISYSLVASLLLLLTQKLRLIPKESESFELLGGILLKHILQLITNGHSIASFEMTSDFSFEDKRIATAIYPTVSLMNHSCDPNVIPLYDKKMLIVRAAKPIAKGQQVMNCYGPHCKRMSTKDRQTALLEQYFFKCDCSPCLSQTEDTSSALMCSQCKEAIVVDEAKDTVVCLNCKKSDFDLKSMLKEVEKGLKLLSDGSKLCDNEKYTESEAVLLDALNTLEKVLYAKNRELGRVKDELSRCYARQHEWSKALDFGRQSVDIVVEVFGDSSVEMCNELIKLSDLEFEFFNTNLTVEESIKGATDCLRTTSNAIKLLTNYSVPDDYDSPQAIEIGRLEERLLYCDMFSKQFYKK